MLLLSALAMAAAEMQYVDEPMVITGRHGPASKLSGKIPYKVVHSGGTYTKKEDVGRNEPCPCGSGKKHKKCCRDRSVQA